MFREPRAPAPRRPPGPGRRPARGTRTESLCRAHPSEQGERLVTFVRCEVLRQPALDPERGVAVAPRVRTGTIGVNHYLPHPAGLSGGFKASGLGREFGPEALAGYL
ncbi:aldehyde dehydrogenase family protein [Streptomyces griseorubiginosus]|uniref:aldehyde dehydrogenase family protein n=1 Tax=Streptomyces griseorubiginosus TaxID=67304 RepID=UPI0036C26F1C